MTRAKPKLDLVGGTILGRANLRVSNFTQVNQLLLKPKPARSNRLTKTTLALKRRSASWARRQIDSTNGGI